MHREKGRRGRLAAASVAIFFVSIINQGTLGRVMATINSYKWRCGFKDKLTMSLYVYW